MRSTVVIALMIVSLVSEGQKVEAESGTLTGTVVESSRGGFSGDGYVTGFEDENDAVTITVELAVAGLYELIVGYAAPYGEKTNDIYVNGTFAGSQIFAERNTFGESVFGKVSLGKGSNAIKILKNWGYFEVDYIRMEPATPNEIHRYPETLINPNATEVSQVVYRYLRDLYSHRIISGQQASEGGSSELNYIQEHTGKIPAIKGFDLIDYSPSRVANGTTSQQTERSVAWWETGGLVSQMWHWNAPKDLLDTEDAPWWSGFYTYATTFDLSKAMSDPGSEEYELIIRDIDVIAEELKTAADSDVPLLWRPLHEAEGGWFWWGARGPEPCVWLWKLMYDRMTNHHQLNNLIWVWTGTNSESAMDWYPGDEYVDIIGADIYLEDQNYSASFSLFDDMAGIHEGQKILTMSETGTIPDPDALDEQRSRWSWFCVWSGGFITDGVKNEVTHINEVYNHEYVITFDELPDFDNYESPDFPEEPTEPLVARPKAKNQLKVYPNPTTDFISIRHPDEGEQMLVDIFSLKGGHVMHVSVWSDTRVDVRNLDHGMYIARVTLQSGVYQSFKFIKQ